jgi:hypothetical protein
MSTKAIWFVGLLLFPAWAIMAFRDFQRGRGALGVYLQTDRAAHPRLFWLITGFNALFVMLSAVIMAELTRDLFL